MLNRIWKSLELVMVLVAISSGYQTFQSKIPNGDKIPHPCQPGKTWIGVGHQNDQGSGIRNPFGVAFKAAGETWTEDLCNADTDGDGKINGDELGDPDCTWISGGNPNRTTDLSHPGVCEPVDSAKCKQSNTWDLGCPASQKAFAVRHQSDYLLLFLSSGIALVLCLALS